MSLNDQPYTVVGVMPPRFDFPERTQVWVAPRFMVPQHPLSPGVDPRTMPGAHYFDSIARLRTGLTIAEARADVDAVIRRIAERRPHTEARSGVWIVSLHQSQVGDVREALLVLLGAVGLVLLIACANVANLLLARGARRGKEFAIRRALGASGASVVRQLLTESALLAVCGGGLGILLASTATRPLTGLVPEGLMGAVQFSINGHVLAFTALASLLAAVFFGMIPALQGSQVALTEALKETGRSIVSGRQCAQGMLIVAESALTVVLLVGAGLLLRSFLRLTKVHGGFDPTHVITLKLSLPLARYSDAAERDIFVRKVLDGISALPGVRSASVVTRLPLDGGESHRGVEIEGHPTRPDEMPSILYSVATPEYFSTMGIPLLRGRDFTDRDDANAPGVVIGNEAMARAFWPGTDPVGRRIKFGDDAHWREIVGIVGNTRQGHLNEPAVAMFYAPYAQDAWPFLTVAIRTTGDPASLATEAEKAVHAVDQDQAVYDLRTMSEVVATSVSPQRLYMLLLGIFATLALALAAIGVLGVVLFAVAQRTHEIGIRMALGAEKTDVLKLVVGQGFKLTMIGVAIGIIGALVLTQFLSSQLYGVRPTDPLTFFVASLTLTVVALLASYIPARRATKVDPMVALRHE